MGGLMETPHDNFRLETGGETVNPVVHTSRTTKSRRDGQ